MRITWKKQPRERGLAGVCQIQRGYDLRIDGKEVGGGLWCRNKDPWMWAVAKDDFLGIPWNNSAARGVYYQDIERAKAECKAYVVKCLKAREEGKR